MFADEVLEKLVGTTILSAEIKDGGGLTPDEIRISTVDGDMFVITHRYDVFCMEVKDDKSR